MIMIVQSLFIIIQTPPATADCINYYANFATYIQNAANFTELATPGGTLEEKSNVFYAKMSEYETLEDVDLEVLVLIVGNQYAWQIDMLQDGDLANAISGNIQYFGVYNDCTDL